MGRRAQPKLTFAQAIAIGTAVGTWMKNRDDASFVRSLEAAGIELARDKDGKLL